MRKARSLYIGSISIASIHARILNHRVIPALRLTFDALRPRLGDRFIEGGDLNTCGRLLPLQSDTHALRHWY